MWPKDAGAQTLVPFDWSAKPAGLPAGAKFRLLFITTTTTDARSKNELLYDGYVQLDVHGNAALRPYMNHFKAVASYPALDASTHTAMTGAGTGISIWWVGGKKVADSYTDFWDGTWDNEALGDLRNEHGAAITLTTQIRPWTGTTSAGGNGSKAVSSHVGNAAGLGVVIGNPGRDPGGPIDSGGSNVISDLRTLYGISPVFQVQAAAAKPTLTIDVPPWDRSRMREISGGSTLAGGNIRIFRITSTPVTTSALSFSYTVSGTATHGTSGAVDYQTLPGSDTIASGRTSQSFAVRTKDDSVDEPNETIVITLASGTGYNIGAPASATLEIRDDDPTVVSLARSGTGNVVEGTAMKFAVTLGRPLVAGEIIDAPLSVTGVRGTATVLPSKWTLTATGTGTTLTGADTTTPKIRFSGAGARTATFSLTVKDSGVSGDLGGRTITVALGPDGDGANGFDHPSLGTNVDGRIVPEGTVPYGGADPHGTQNSFSFDTVAAATPEVTISGGSAVTEGAGATFTVSASPAPTANLTVNLIVADAPNADFVTSTNQGTGKTVTVPTSGSATYTVATVADTIDEPNGPVTVTVAPGSGYTVGSPGGSAPVTVNDDDATTVTLGTPDKTATEGSNADTALLRLDLNRALRSGESLAIPLRFAGGVLDTDFTLALSGSPTGVALSGSTVTVSGSAGGSATRTDIHLSAAADSNATDETVTVSIPASSSGNAPKLTATGLGGGATGSRNGNGQITLAEPPVLSLVPLPVGSSTTVTEGNIGQTIKSLRTTLSSTPPAAFSYEVCIDSASTATWDPDGTRGSGSDFDFRDDQDDHISGRCWTDAVATTDSGTLEGMALAIYGDTTYESDETIRLTLRLLGNPQGVVLGNATATYTIRNDDAAPPTLPVVTIYGGPGVTEGAGAVFTVRADPAPPAPLRVSLAVSKGTGYVAAGDEGSRTLTLDAGADRATVTVPTVADTADEPDGVVLVALFDGAGYVLGVSSSNGTPVSDDDPTAVTLTVTDKTATEGSATDTASMTLTLSRGLVRGERLAVPLQLSGGTLDTDFALRLSGTPAGVSFAGRTVTFTGPSKGATATAATVLLSASNDGNTTNETLAVSIPASSSGNGPTLAATGLGGGATGTGTGQIAVTDDGTAHPPPTAPVASFAQDAGSAPESAGTRNVRVHFAPAPQSTITLSYTVDGTATPGTDYTALPGTVSVSPGATNVDIAVAIADDGAEENAETVILTLAPGSGYTVGSASKHTLTVNDDDGPPVVTIVRTSGATLTEGASATFTVSAHPAPGAALDVRLTVADAPHGNFVASGNEGTRTVTLAADTASTTFTLATETDSTDESNGPVTVAVAASTATPATYAVGAPASATVTMHDDDPTAVELSTPDATATEGSATDTARITVRLTGRRLRAGERLVVPLGFSGGTLGTDFTLALSGTPTGITLSGATVTFTGPDTGVTAGTAEIVLTALDDADTGDDVVTVSIPASSSAGTPRLTATGLGGGATGSRSGNGRITVDDDDTAAVPVLTITGGAAVTEGTGATFTVSASPAPASALVVNRNIADAPGADFVAGADEGDDSVWVLPASQTSATFTVATVADSTAEPSGPVTATLRPRVGDPSSYTVGAPSSATVTVNDDDGGPPPVVTPVASFAQAAGSAPESAGTRTVRVTFAPATAAALTLGYTVGGTASPDTDYTALPGTVAVALGATGVDIAVAIADDSAVEVAETVILTLAPGIGYTVGSPNAHTLTVADDDVVPSVVGIARSSGATLAEGGSATFTVSASPAPVSALTVRLAVADAPEADFVAAGVEAAPTVTIAAGTASATFTLATAPDATDEPSGAVTVTVAAGAGYTPHATNASAEVTVRDDDATVVTLASPPGDLSETGGTKTVTVTLGRALVAPESLTMPLALAGEAVRGPDYTVSAAPATGVTWAGLGGTSPTATFTGGARTATLAFAAVDDGAAEGAEAVTVARGTPSANAHLHGGATGAGAVDFSIVERPTIGFSSATYTVDEGETLTVEMRLSTPWPNDIGTALKVVPGTAGTGDYDFRHNVRRGVATYLFSFWKTQTVRVHIPTVQDALREGDESFTLRFAGTAGTERIYGHDAHGRWRLLRLERVPFGLREATVTIRDDETPAVGVVVSREALALDEGGSTGSYTVALRSAPAAGETVTVTAAVDDAAVARVHTGAGAPGASATLVFTDADWSQARTVTVTPQGDADTGDERTRIAHAVSGPGAWDGVAAPAVAVAVADDDAVALPQVTVAVAEGAAATVFEGTAARFTVRAHPAPAAGLTVDLNVADAPNADFVASGDEGTRTVTIAPGAASADVTVATLDNTADEPSGPVTVTVAPSTANPATYAPGSASSATVAVLDDDATAVTLAVTDPTATEGDAADTAAIALTLNRELRTGERLRVPLQLAGGAVGTDFTLALAGSPAGVSLSGATVTFTGAATPSAASATVRLAALPDPDTIDGTVTVSIPASSTGTPRLYAGGLGGGATGAGTATVVLADAAAPLTVRLTPGGGRTTPPGQAGLPEGATVEFNLQLSRAPAADEVVLVPLVLGGNATRGADYTLSCREVAGVTCSNLDSGNPSITFDGSLITFTYQGTVLRLHLVEDDTEESTETVTLSLGDNTHSQGIVDAPDAVVVSFARNDFAVRENNGPIEPVMVVTPPAGRDIPLFFTLGGTATEGESGDYYFIETPVLPAGSSRKSFVILIVDDEVDELDETIILTLDTTRLPSWVTVGSIATATLTIPDSDPTVVSLARTGPGALAEGEKTELTVTLGRALLAGEVVGVPLEVSGAGVTTADWTLALKAGAANTGVTLSHETTATPRVSLSGAGARTAVLELTAVEDGVDDAETLTVALGPDGTGANGFDRPELGTTVDDGAGPHPSAHRFDVLVDVVAGVSVKPGPAVTEGARATFTVVMGAPRARRLQVGLEVGQSGEYVDRHYQGILGRRFVHIRPGATSATFTVPTANDETNEAHGAVTARVLPGAHYVPAVAPNDRASVTVNDDDGGLTGPALSVNDVTAREGADHNAEFTVTLSPAPTGRVTVSYSTRESTPVSARSGEDYVANRGTLRFAPGETAKTVYVFINEDFHAEPPETFELLLAHARGGAWIADGVGVGTIVNDDPLPAAWLARFGRTVAEQALEGIADRRAAARTPGLRGTLAGQALSFGAPGDDDPTRDGIARRFDDAGAVVPGTSAFDGAGSPAPADSARGVDGRPERSGPGGFDPDFGDAQAPPHTMTMREALLGSRFTLTGAQDASGGTAAFWGRAAQGSFNGREGPLALDGDVTTAMLGADYARDRWLVGLALTQSEGEGGWTDTEPGVAVCPDGMDARTSTLCEGAVRSGDGTIESSLTAAIPYASLQASERVGLWGALGVGAGRVTLAPESGRSLAADTDWRMAAAGVRGALLAPGAGAEASGPALALTSDALWARTASDRTRDLAASQSDVTRLRLGLEGSWRFALDGGTDAGAGASLVPRLEVGARHDGGDAETGFGLELGGGLAWDDPGLGLSLDLSGRTLLAHEDDDLEDRGYAASLAFDPDPGTERGPSASLRQELGGQASGGLDALFTPASLDERTGSDAASRWTAEAAYGFPAFGGRYTGSPHVGLGLATGARDYTLGWRWTPAANAPDLSFEVKATHRESDADAPEHTVGFEVRATW